MNKPNPRCVVVEIPEASADGQQPPVRDLLPWADPYIAMLLTKHRLQSALDESLRFVADQAFTSAGANRRIPGHKPGRRAR